jgi:hypothetical protein
MSRFRSVFFEMSSRTRTASAVTSGPTSDERSKVRLMGRRARGGLLTDSITGEDYDFETANEWMSVMSLHLGVDTHVLEAIMIRYRVYSQGIPADSGTSEI